MFAVKFSSLCETVKDVYLLHTNFYVSNYPLFRQALFELQHIMDDIKVYMKTNKDDSDRVFNDGSDEDSNVLTQD